MSDTKWTTTPPTAPGWYAVRPGGHKPSMIANMYGPEDHLRWNATYDGMVWSGLISAGCRYMNGSADLWWPIPYTIDERDE